MIAGILDAGESSRFAKNLVRGSHMASNVDIYYNLYNRYQTQFVLFGIPTQSHTMDELKTALLREIHRLQTEPVNEVELNRIKTQIIAQKTFEKDSIFGQAMELGLLETIGLGWETAEAYTAKIEAITPAQIQEAAQRYFNDNTITEARLYPLLQSKELQ